MKRSSLTANQKEIIHQTEQFVQLTLAKAEGGHDWFHIQRVWRSSKFISQQEGGNLFIIELGALLHDIADSKFHDGNEEIGPQMCKSFLLEMGVETAIIEHVANIISSISFKAGKNESKFKSKELDIVQDADRLDALGAIGIARAFNYGGFKGRSLYDPSIPPNLHMSKEAYKNTNAPTINHFYEKLLLLKDLMNTKTGIDLAEERHEFMLNYLEQFYTDWNGSS